jgi:hypothetical protein
MRRTCGTPPKRRYMIRLAAPGLVSRTTADDLPALRSARRPRAASERRFPAAFSVPFESSAEDLLLTVLHDGVPVAGCLLSSAMRSVPTTSAAGATSSVTRSTTSSTGR